jgi:hypothetical protein
VVLPVDAVQAAAGLLAAAAVVALLSGAVVARGVAATGMRW